MLTKRSLIVLFLFLLSLTGCQLYIPHHANPNGCDFQPVTVNAIPGFRCRLVNLTIDVWDTSEDKYNLAVVKAETFPDLIDSILFIQRICVEQPSSMVMPGYSSTDPYQWWISRKSTGELVANRLLSANCGPLITQYQTNNSEYLELSKTDRDYRNMVMGVCWQVTGESWLTGKLTEENRQFLDACRHYFH